VKPLLAVFIDGLKPDSIAHMPFLNSLVTQRRIRTELGYSPTCYASMYSGVHPNKHKIWFTWKYSPNSSPYRWLSKLRFDAVSNNVFTNYAFYRLTKFSHSRLPSWHGQMDLQWWYIPIQYWHNFDLAIKRHWSSPGFIDGYPSIFDLLSAKEIPYEIVGISGNLEQSSDTVRRHNGGKLKPFTLFFIGDIDPLSHRYGQDSAQTIERLGDIDSILEKRYRMYQQEYDNFSFILFSDHGHVRVNNRIDLKDLFKANGESLEDYIFFIDANYARFWFRNNWERERVEKVLSNMRGKGFIMKEEHFIKYAVDMPDNRYGDLIYYLDAPNAFTHRAVLFGKEFMHASKSMHGYLPDNPDCDAVFISNREVKYDSHLLLVDIVPSILAALDLEVPSHMDGRILWK